MISRKILYIAIAVFSSILIVLLVSQIWHSYHGSSQAEFSCSPGPDEQCPSDLFLSDYRRLKQLNAEITKESRSDEQLALQRKIDETLGISQRLNAQIPAGYKWDEKRERFIKAPVPVVPPVVPPQK